MSLHPDQAGLFPQSARKPAVQLLPDENPAVRDVWLYQKHLAKLWTVLQERRDEHHTRWRVSGWAEGGQHKQPLAGSADVFRLRPDWAVEGARGCANGSGRRIFRDLAHENLQRWALWVMILRLHGYDVLWILLCSNKKSVMLKILKIEMFPFAWYYQNTTKYL